MLADLVCIYDAGLHLAGPLPLRLPQLLLPRLPVTTLLR
jgi:hypothetical protein